MKARYRLASHGVACRQTFFLALTTTVLATVLACNCGGSPSGGVDGSTGDSGNANSDSGGNAQDSGSSSSDAGADAGIDASVPIGNFCTVPDPPDAGPLGDAGAAGDSGARFDAGSAGDAGRAADAGSADAGASADGGPRDSGAADAAVAQTDAGGGADAGSRPDAGVAKDGGVACPSGQTCLTVCGATGGFCSVPCSATCPQGYCMTFGTTEFCVFPCSTSADCPAGQVCDYDPIDQLNLCLPDCRVHPEVCWATGSVCSADAGTCDPATNQPFGQSCGACFGGCAAGYDCLNPGNSSYCSQTCGAANSCPVGSGAQCVAQSSLTGEDYCGWPCTGPTDTSCPTGLTCQTTDGGYLCQ